MRARSISASFAAAAILGLTAWTSARAIELGYAGRLAEEDGAPLAGPVDVTLRFFGSSTGGDQLGASLPYSGVALRDGVFHLTLSMSEAQQNAIFGDGSRAVYVEVEAAGKVYPRQGFQAVPVALRVPVDNDTLVFSSDSSKLTIARVDMDHVTGLATALDGKVDAVPASGSASGYLAAADWTRFDAKQSAITAATTLAAGSLATSQQGGVLVNPYGASASETGELRFADLSRDNYVGFKAPDALSANRIWTLPASDGASGDVLVTNGTGVLSWTTPAGGGTGLVPASNLADLTDVSAARSNLGLGPLATAGAVGSSQIADSSIVNADIAGTAQIATSKLSGAVTAITGHGLGALATLSAIDSAQITDGQIADADVSASAALATSKLSGSVTSIAGHGLGSLATLNAVDSAQITDGQIVDADLSASAAIADSKLATIATAGKVSGAAITSGTIGGTATFSGSGGVSTSGAVAGTGNFSVNGTGAATTELRFGDNDNSNYVGFKGPGTVAANNVWTLPATDGGSGQFLSTNGSGVLSWGSPAGGGDMMASANLSDLANVSTARTNLGLGSLATLNVVGSANITDGQIANADISGTAAIDTSKLSGAVTSISGHGLGGLATLSGVGSTEITDASIANADISGTAAIATSKLSGSVTSISGHGLGALATLSGVGSTEITDASIANADISGTAAIATSKLSGSVTSISGHGLGALATLSGVGSTEITDSSIANADISPAAAIATSKLSGALTAISGHGLGALATASAVGSTEITDGSVASADISDGTIVNADISGAAGVATSKLSGAVTAITGHGLGSLATLSAIGSAQITDGQIADADVSASAALATSKLSGAVTSIAGHGLGSLATLSAIGSTDITDGAISNADISGTAAVATSKLSGAVTSISGHGLGGLATLSAVGAAQITDASIANADISGTAAIDTSKLSGAVTAISGHGLGALATLSAVSTTQITDSTIANADISATAAIDSSKIANGGVSSTEFQYLDGVTSSVQTQLDAKASAAGPTFTGAILSALGSAAAPSYSFTGDPDTGVWSSGADAVNVSTGGSERLRVTNTGNVGIGTTSPNGILHVAGATSIFGAGEGATPSASTIRGPNASGSNIAGANLTLQASNGTGTGGSGSIFFQTAPTTVPGSTANTLATRMTILPNGNVGVGTTAPTTTLQVAFASGSGTILEVDNTASGWASLNIANLFAPNNAAGSTACNSLGVSSTSNNAFKECFYYSGSGSTSNRYDLYSWGASNPVASFVANGNVGIGTTSPTAKLDVYTAGSSASTWMGRVVARGDAYAVTMGEYANTAMIGGHNSALNAWANLAINAGGGNVGIGTTDPQAKLQVNGQVVSAMTTISNLAVDFNTGNFQTNSVAAGTLQLNNMVDGTTYTLILTNATGGSYVLSGSSVSTWKCAPTCSSNTITVTAGKHTLLSLTKAGTTTYVFWVKDL